MTDTILIIEDNQDMLVNASGILKLANYNVLTAENGKVGLEMARDKTPDLVLCDIMMPVLDGYGVLQAFENIPEMAGIPFVFISGKSEHSDFRAAMDLGADDYLAKPFSGHELLRIVSARLKKRRMSKGTPENNGDGQNEFLDTSELRKGLSELLNERHIKKIRKKNLLFSEGDPSNHFHFVVSGKIKTFKANELGKEYIIGIHGENEFIGLTSFENQKHNQSAMTIEESEVAFIPRKELLQALHSNSKFAMKFIKMTSRYLAEAENKLLHLAYDSARKRVAEAILVAARKYGKTEGTDVTFTLLRENISGLSGISPESVSRIITEFRAEGLIESNNGSITILNLRKLESLKN